MWNLLLFLLKDFHATELFVYVGFVKKRAFSGLLGDALIFFVRYWLLFSRKIDNLDTSDKNERVNYFYYKTWLNKWTNKIKAQKCAQYTYVNMREHGKYIHY